MLKYLKGMGQIPKMTIGPGSAIPNVEAEYVFIVI